MSYLNRDPHLPIATFLIKTPRKAQKDILKIGKMNGVTKSLETVLCYYSNKKIFFLSEWGILVGLTPQTGSKYHDPSQLRFPKYAVISPAYSNSWKDFDLEFFDDKSFIIGNFKKDDERVEPMGGMDLRHIFFPNWRDDDKSFREHENLYLTKVNKYNKKTKEVNSVIVDFEKIPPHSEPFYDPNSRRDVKEMFFQVASMFMN